MPRVFLVSILTLMLVNVGPAAAQKKFIGITGGATLGDFGSITSTSRWGGTVGVTMGYRNFDWSIVRLEGIWAQRGAEGIRLDYIEVPVLVGTSAHLGSGGNFRGGFYTGVQVGFKTGCVEETTTPGVTSCAAANTGLWGIPFGVQLGQWTPDGAFVGVDVRYLFGLTNAFSTSFAYNRGWTFKLLLGKSIGD